MSTEGAVRRSDRARTVLSHLPERDPALALLALWCDMVDGRATETVTAQDAVCVGRDLATLPLQERIGLIGRHVLHVALRHEAEMCALAERIGADFDGDLFALCAEAFANECLLRGGHALPRPAVRLASLLERVLPGSDAGASDLLSLWPPERLYARIVDSGPDTRAQAASYAAEHGFRPGIRPGFPDPEAGRKAVAWRAHLLRALRGGGGAGRGIGRELRFVEERPVSRTPWERRLRGLLAKALAETPRQVYHRPRSAWIAADANAIATGRPRPVFEPGLQRRGLRPRLVVGLDSSGSIGSSTLALFAAELAAIMRRTGAETHLLCFDEEVYLERQVDDVSAFSALSDAPLRRDGGTSFVDLMKRANALAPSAIVVLSDMAGAHGAAPAAPVIWATPAAVRRPPPYGTVVDLAC